MKLKRVYLIQLPDVHPFIEKPEENLIFDSLISFWRDRVHSNEQKFSDYSISPLKDEPFSIITI